MTNIKDLAEDYYHKLDEIYEEMIEVEGVDNNDDWLRAETKLNECLEFLSAITMEYKNDK